MTTIKISITEAQESIFGGEFDGGCISCGEITEGGVEPDARKYKCAQCGQMSVYGLEQLILMDAQFLED